MMTRQHIISYQNVERWNRFSFFRFGFIVAQLSIYVAGQSNKIIMYFIESDHPTTDIWILDEIE